MASKEQILSVLAKASGAISRQEIEEEVGESYRKFQTQLDRWVKQELIQDVGDHHYEITDKGRADLERGDERDAGDGDGDVSGEAKDIAHEIKIASYTISDKEKFIQLGLDAGMTNKSLLRGTTTLIWNRGEPRDLDSVWQGFNEANIDKDIAKRWFNFWAAHIKKEVPLNIAKEISGSGGSKEKSDKDKLLLTHDMTSEGYPIYVGEGQGALTHDEAFELAKIRESTRAKAVGQAKSESPGDSLAARAVEKVITDMSREPSSPSDDTERFITQFKAIKELLGDGKSESGDGTERTISIIKAVREMFPENRPQITQTQPSTQYLIDKQTGQMQQITPGTPIIIQTAPQSSHIPIQMDQDGKPVVPQNLETWLRLEDFRGEQSRKQENHEVKLELAKGFKDLLKHAQSALSHMGEED